MTFMNAIHHAGRLARIVLDECHTVLLGKPSFRPALSRLGNLVQYGVQLVLLTATLPPTEEQLLWERLHMDAVHRYVRRDPTARPDLAYHAQPLHVALPTSRRGLDVGLPWLVDTGGARARCYFRSVRRAGAHPSRPAGMCRVLGRGARPATVASRLRAKQKQYYRSYERAKSRRRFFLRNASNLL